MEFVINMEKMFVYYKIIHLPFYTSLMLPCLYIYWFRCV